MLTDLIIKNFAIIDRLHVSFGPGFNILTGETGAGKSIIIDAVGLLLGERARPDLIRTGEDEASVEAVFDLSGQPGLVALVEAAGFEGGDELLVRRTIARNGRNRIYVNGSLATLGQLQPLSSRFLTIYGQHASQSLQRADSHLRQLDRFAGLAQLLTEYRGHFDRLHALGERLAQLDEAERERQQRLDLLNFQSREISEAKIRAGEDDELEAERLLLQHAERLSTVTQGGYEELYGQERAICERLGGIAAGLAELASIDPQLGVLAETLQSAHYSLEDAAMELRSHGERISFEPGRQNEVEERLAQLGGLKRKYAPTLEAILAHLEQVDGEIADLSNIDAAREQLQQQLAKTREQLEEAGGRISVQRREAARQLHEAVERELKGLAMPKARFEVRLVPLAEPGPRGLERGEFYLAANPGEAAKPLAKIASGGELSRIMLALKRAAPDGDGIPTLIFDEVDAGIGGVAATAVGEKLRGVARGAQVLCITHLPQVAAFADCHYRVEKGETDGRTMTRLVTLEGEERVLEMARMLGGARVTDRTLEHARELIGQGAV